MVCFRSTACRLILPAAVWLLVAAAFSAPLLAEVVRFDITSRQPFADGKSFGDVGPYEKIIGTVHFAMDPAQAQNRAIVDIDLAPRDDQGLVEFSSDLYILAPKDLSRGNGAAFYEVNNRGSKVALWFVNDASPSDDPNDAGNGFLMRQGFVVVWSGWDGELLPSGAGLQLHAPFASSDNEPITGPVRYEICAGQDGATRMNVSAGGHGGYRPVAEALSGATLTRRLRPESARVAIPREQFRIHTTDVESNFQGQLPSVELELPAGFTKGYLYELIYQAQQPLVHGVCFAAVRDLMAGLRHGEGLGNPLLVDGESAVDRTYGFGVSQAGRFLREFLYWGFNEDEQGRQVFDGLMPHVSGGGLGSFNHRFARPTVYATQHRDHFGPIDRFPFSYEVQVDELTGERDGILKRCDAAGVAPKVIHMQSSAEYWSRSGSLVHTDTSGSSDAKLPERVRIFAFGGTQHTPAGFPPSPGSGQLPQNPGDYHPFLRALLVALDQWCRGLQPAPESVYPTLGEGSLVHWYQPSTGFPAIPGVRYPEVIQQPPLLDFGPRWKAERIIDVQPPRVLGHYRVLTPRCGPDGNELGCLLPPEVAVPLATYTGWSLRSSAAGAENDLVGLNGSYIPFAASAEAGRLASDPRQSIEERYGSVETYKQQLAAVCAELVERRLLLDEDVPRIVDREQARAKLRFEEAAAPP
ncbi:alpha/beta hydrolase domain-containing protein [Pirellulales bacterium]|nr:alpha/beta hydrolase domain-containing protein [Pirellulales bacterium]